MPSADRQSTGVVASTSGLDDLRAKLDEIDARLLEQIRDRINCCLEIADYKRRHDVPMMQPHRIAVVQERAARYGAEHGVDGEFLRRLYDLIIGETCRVEDLAMADPERFAVRPPPAAPQP
jgi:chorismate mutase-like protein